MKEPSSGKTSESLTQHSPFPIRSDVWDSRRHPRSPPLSPPLRRTRGDCIESSIQNGGNSRSIIMAIQSAAEVLSTEEVEIEEDFFEKWQAIFAGKVIDSMFKHTSFSETSKGLIGQLNLLLDASADPNVSDVLLSHHFAIRAIPDNGETISARPRAKIAETGGWLYLATNEERGLGYSLVFLPGPYQKNPRNGTIFWQKTFFPRPESDCLLYLSAVRAKGYFSTNLIGYPTRAVVKALWRSHAADSCDLTGRRPVSNNPSWKDAL